MVKAPDQKYASLRVDDYLDLLNLAKQLQDTRWQKEIIRKLERLNNTSIHPLSC
ncbi:hypothetical protein ACTHSJ_14290 [Paenibacillus cellulositrophicus]|jgi:hypothetical protein|uniref:Uncharacterized protein n=3 Tax=Paenibacillus TaxID=44249 RepID=A0A839TRP1_9BACL|nr:MULTISPECIES: hypothetical protein [Paenibacillus]MBB3129392.1 hypothetical protein [Paenibacillus rhizosphaerae]MBJ9992823.1 hypothetical protein [Paenibacillus sp. S28]MCM2996300.1 hypothetical protein [Paenibacillus cellulositrophicus]MEC0178280.1 hypothetical protein [Paenibacillus favisporus]RED36723.1 hypothetical protein C7820_3506 [Paenibacillus sp. VMFN-D1]